MKNDISRNSKPTAVFDAENNRYIISPVDTEEAVSVRTILRAIKETTHTTWRHIMEFTGYAKQSDIFKMTYAGQHCSKKLRAHLAEYITKSGNVAYLYDKDHKPAGAASALIHPTITNNESGAISAIAKLYTLVCSRIVVRDKLERQLKLVVSADVGYVTDGNKFAIANPGTAITAYGTARKLNDYLKTIKYASDVVGSHEITITIDDQTGVSAGIISTSVSVNVAAGAAVIVPTLTVPAKVTLNDEGDTELEGIVVTGDNNEILTLKVTPNGCEVYGIKNNIGYVADGETYTTRGTVTQLNANFAAVKARTGDATSAKVLFELGFGNGSRIRKYVEIAEATEQNEPGSPEPQGPAVVDGSTVGNTTVG